MRAAAAHGVDEIDFTCAADNKPMQRLARKFSAELHFMSNNVTGRLKARPATAFALWREAASDAGDYASALVDAQLRALGRAHS